MKRIEAYSRVVFDFNGTLLDDVWIGIHTVNEMLRRRGLQTLDALDDYYRVFGFPIEDYYRRLGFDFEREPYDMLAHEWIEGYQQAEKTVGLRDGTTALLEFLHTSGVTLDILSATEEKMLLLQLTRLGILPYFRRVFGRDDIYAADKTALAAVCASSFSGGPTLYIGDTDHDVACARVMGADCLLIEGGHQPRTLLEKTGMPVFHSLLDILGYLSEETEKKP